MPVFVYKSLKRMHTLRHDNCLVDKLIELKVVSIEYLKREKQVDETGKNGI